ncbi:hypothetical protein [Actinomadura sp. WAC 06369]|uniref:hypothetical protein n=1 Tax=Actinomadura sp. WAC 06369 TaxID=2203193 RepID=UPI000F784851|nr:hypothetical protein [Actinomadura sp. WAC 06369]RSN56669.1 hypothetical protein DMH08_24935 [Actinomadura sp. WAC 06369]
MDVGCKAKEAVNGWFADLVSSAAGTVFDLLGATVLGTPELDAPEMSRARELWGVAQTIANTCFVLVITAGGVLLMAGHSLPGTELTPGQLVARVVGAFLASNLSLIVLGYAISLANGLSRALLTMGAESIDPGVVAEVIAGYIAAQLVPSNLFPVLIALGAVVLALCLVFVYIVRVALTIVLIAAAPIALMLHALPVTDGLARLWWRGITGLLAIQVCQSLVLATAFRLLFTDSEDDRGSVLGLPSVGDVTDLLLAVCLLWLMVRIPAWVARTVWRPAQPRLLSGLLKSLVLYRLMGRLLPRRGRAATVRFQPPTPPPPPPPPPPAPTRRLALPGPTRPMLPAGPPSSPALPSGPSPDPALPTGPTPPALSAGSAPFALPAGPAAAPGPRSSAGGRAMQLPLPIPAKPKPAGRRPVQTALPIAAARIPRPPAAPAAAAPARPRPRSGQLMLPGMPRRPVPHRQLTLWTEPPKTRRRR